MIEKIILVISTLLVVLQTISAAKLAVLQHPSYYSFDTKNELKLSEFKNLLLASSGYSIPQPIEWKGLSSKNSLSTPRVTLLFVLNGKNVDLNKFGNNLATIQVNEDSDFDFDYLKNLNNAAVRSFEQYPLEISQKNLDEDCGKNSLFYVVNLPVDSINNLDETVNSFVSNVTTKCSAVVNQKSDLLVYVLSADLSNRVKRQAKKVSQKSSVKQSISGIVVNPALFYSDQYPAMFNLIFWTSLILAITVFAIAYGMCSMDPGLNTVIYRMTSQRIKKDQ